MNNPMSLKAKGQCTCGRAYFTEAEKQCCINGHKREKMGHPKETLFYEKETPMNNLFEMATDIAMLHKKGIETGFAQAKLKYETKIAQLEDEIKDLNEELKRAYKEINQIKQQAKDLICYKIECKNRE